MNRKKVIVIGAFVIATTCAVVAMYDYSGAERLAFDGRVENIEWKSGNHGMPLVTLRTKAGLAPVQHYRLLIDPHLQVGDHYSKAGGSRDCTINGDVRHCVH